MVDSLTLLPATGLTSAGCGVRDMYEQYLRNARNAERWRDCVLVDSPRAFRDSRCASKVEPHREERGVEPMVCEAGVDV